MKISMKKVTAGVLMGLGLAASHTSVAMAEDSPFTANVGLFSEYVFRGVSQTAEKPALQGGFDYAHASGFYLGTWGSNISETFYPDGNGGGANLEIDVYGGYKMSLTNDVSLNVGLLQYMYPGATDFNNLEAYAALGYKWLTAKASYALTDYFGATDSKGTTYLEANADIPLPGDFTLGLHVGHTAGDGAVVDYTDYKVGVSVPVAGFTLGLAYTDTDLDGSKAVFDKNKNVGDGRAVFSVSRAF